MKIDIEVAQKRINELEDELAARESELADCYEQIHELANSLRSARGQLSQIEIDRTVEVA